MWLNRQPAQHGETLKRKTQNYYLIALRAFLKHLQREGVATLAPERIELARVPDRSLDLITSAELERLMEAPLRLFEKEKTDTGRRKLLRDWAILELLFSTGLRVSELTDRHHAGLYACYRQALTRRAQGLSWKKTQPLSHFLKIPS